MTATLEVHVYHQHRLVFQQEFEGAVELGRQAKDEAAPFHATWMDDPARPPACWRLVIGGQRETLIARHHVFLEPLAASQVRLTNRSDKQPVRLGHRSLPPLASTVVALPALRLKGLYLALATLAFAEFTDKVIVRHPNMISPTASGTLLEPLKLFGFRISTDAGDRQAFLAHLGGTRGLLVGVPQIEPINRRWSVQFSRRMEDGNGRFLGIAVMSLDPVALSRDLAEMMPGQNDVMFVVRRDGTIAQHRGVTAAPGLYVVGQRFQHWRRSNFIGGVGRDAALVARHIAASARLRFDALTAY